MSGDKTEKSEATDSSEKPPQEVVVSFEELAGGRAEISIDHEGQRYRLRATKNGRLLLNK